ncbi:YadA C-terminal domain-containing protein, partial [Acinetobacter sp. Lyrl_1]|uniref:YadA C-terminal domain-containing protein n=1 Tax=Acinetobacter sp. Lyrl_1 TaxID=3110920 RepID=UPI003F7C325D
LLAESSAVRANQDAELSAMSATASASSAVDSLTYATASASSAVDSLTYATASASSAAAAQYIVDNIDSTISNSSTFKNLAARVDYNSKQIDENRDRAARGIAGIAAMVNIPTPAYKGATSFGLGLGHYDSKSAIAIGASHYFNNGVSVKGSLSNGFGDSRTAAVGAGMSFTW